MYQVIARKYRPQSFDDLLGQDQVQRTLRNAIESRRIAHGYIFSGQRGTGKTTVARILARCLNCVHGPTSKPCGICASCIEIGSSSSPDVIEIDAASNRGINEMREIRENVRYRPARDQYKVFIIDEAHQITKEAFNAMLKTLEEPPEWVVFILCTTEANEIPNTIASRCQHFTFRSVDFSLLMDRLRSIAQSEGVEASDEVFSVLAQAGEGSVRDSLSALDQAIACCGASLDVEQVRTLLGAFGLASFEAVAGAIQRGDGAKMLEVVAKLEASGQSIHHFSRELSRFWRDLLVARITREATPLISASEAEQAQYRRIAEPFSEEDLTRYLNLSLAIYKDLQYSLQPRLHLELGLLKLLQAGRLKSIEEALAELGPAREGGANRAPATKAPARLQDANTAVSNSMPSPVTKPAVAESEASAAKPAVDDVNLSPTRNENPGAANPDPPKAAPASDPKFVLQEALRKARMDNTLDALDQADVKFERGELLLRVPKNKAFLLRESTFSKVAAQTFGAGTRVRVEADSTLETARSVEVGTTPDGVLSKESVPAETNIRARALAHPGVKRFQELFPNAQVRNVRDLNE